MPSTETPAEAVILRTYNALRESHDLRYDSLTRSQRPDGHKGNIWVDFIAARKTGTRTGVGTNRVLQLLWQTHLRRSHDGTLDTESVRHRSRRHQD